MTALFVPEEYGSESIVRKYGMKKFLNFAGIITGNMILAFAVVVFVVPGNLMAGGTTGLGLCVEHYLGLPISTTIAIVNVVLFLLGLICLGWKFAVTTLISTFLYPLLIHVLEDIPAIQNITDNKLLAALFAGALMGLGVGIVLKAGASTGGFDIPPLILNKKFGIPVSVTMYAIDIILVLGQITFSTPENVLYGIIVIFLTSVTVNKILVLGIAKAQLMVISDFCEEIRQMMLYQLDCGATMINIETGFAAKTQTAVLSVISNRKLNEAKRMIQSIDSNAFIIISEASEVRGRGFTLDR